MACPDQHELLDLVEGRTSTERQAELERHLDECASCGVAVAEYAALSDDAADPDPPLAAGDMVGRYRVLELLGAGGMGKVYVASDPDLGRRVALKLVRDAGAEREHQVRLLREAQAMARLSHPNVVAIHDVGMFRDRVFAAMELVDGESLAEWLARPPRRPGEVLAVMAQAGRGLAAAHAAGLVHRDFKPANVLVGADGRVRVTDFGLARAHDDALDGPDGEPRDPLRGGRVTESGAVMGTPLYMAPEQHAGQAVDARTDQFAFCIVLYEALYRRRPFAGATASEIAAEVMAGRVRPPPPTRGVPGRVERLIARGLRVAPEERYPSMAALLADLSVGRARRRLVVAAALGAALAAGGAFAFSRGEPGPRCDGAAAFVAEVWGPPRAAAVRDGFAASGHPRAGDMLTRVEPMLDRYAARLAETHTAACAASRLSGEQSDEVLGLRMACLERQRDSLAALADLLAGADRAIVSRAVEATYALPPASDCDAARVLSGRVAAPAAAIAARVDAIQRELARAKALSDAGQHRAARDVARQSAAAAAPLRYQPIDADALYRLGIAEMAMHDAPAAEKALTGALFAATAAGMEPRAIDVATALAYLTGIDMGRQDEGLRWQRQAQALVERLGRRDRRAADAASVAALVARQQGRYADALAGFLAASEIDEQVYGPDHPEVGLMLTYAATMMAELGRLDDADAAARRALAIFEAAYGPDGAGLSLPLSTLGHLLERRGQLDQALAVLERSAALEEAASGSDSVALAPYCLNLGRVRAQLGDRQRARGEFARALALVEKAHGRRHPDALKALNNLAIVDAMDGRLDAAERGFREVASLGESLFGPDHIQVAAAFADLGQAQSLRGRSAEAAVSLQRALSIREKIGGADDPGLVPLLTDLAAIELDRGEAGRASARLERALVLAERQGDTPARGEVRFSLARALRAGRRDPARARALAEAARGDFAGARLKDRVAAVDRFLAAAPQRGGRRR